MRKSVLLIFREHHRKVQRRFKTKRFGLNTTYKEHQSLQTRD